MVDKDSRIVDVVTFKPGSRQEALERAMEIAKNQKEIIEVVICRDVPGKHSGGEDCFCGPKILLVKPDGTVSGI